MLLARREIRFDQFESCICFKNFTGILAPADASLSSRIHFSRDSTLKIEESSMCQCCRANDGANQFDVRRTDTERDFDNGFRGE